MALDFISNIDDVTRYVRGIDVSTTLTTLSPSHRSSSNKLRNIIGTLTYEMLKAYYNGGNTGDEKKTQAVGYIQASLANMMASSHFIFDASERNKSDKNLFRYQEEKQLDIYLENTWLELNSLLTLLASDAELFADFVNTETYKVRSGLYIKSANEFNRYYTIDSSEYFYTIVIYLIKEVQDELEAAYNDFTTVDDAKLKEAICRFISFETMSRACVRLDWTELPKGIRHDMYRELNNKARLSNAQDITIKKFSEYLHNEAEKYKLIVEHAANKRTNSGEFIPPEQINDENDKFYLFT